MLARAEILPFVRRHPVEVAHEQSRRRVVKFSPVRACSLVRSRSARGTPVTIVHASFGDAALDVDGERVEVRVIDSLEEILQALDAVGDGPLALWRPRLADTHPLGRDLAGGGPCDRDRGRRRRSRGGQKIVFAGLKAH